MATMCGYEKLLPSLGSRINFAIFNHRTLNPCTISPYGLYYRIWKIFLVILAIYAAWVSPIEIGFFEELGAILSVLDYMVNGFFAINIVLTFFMAYIDKSVYMLIDNKKNFAKRYVRRCFIVDTSCIIPFQLLVKILPPNFKTCGYIFNIVCLCLWLKSLCSAFKVISEIIESCRAHDYTDVVLVHEHHGVPDGLIVSHMPYGPTAYFGLLNVVTRHEIKDKKAIGTMPKAYPHLIFDNFSTKLDERAANILKYLFPVPKPDTKRISFRHHIYEKHGSPKSIELKEIGPQFELRLYQIKLGMVDQAEAQIEWVIRPYMNTTRTHKFLSD